MPAYKDEERGTWYVQFYYTDWTGERKKKKKRGFALKRDAQQWEQDFLKSQKADMNITLSAFVDMYLEDIGHRVRATTLFTKKFVYDNKIRPYLGNRPMNAITSSDVRKWQNELLSSENQDSDNYSPTYMKYINSQLSALFNYAVKYYNLSENPCHKAGSIGKKNADEMQFWTTDEYKAFIKGVEGKIQAYTAFETLYYTGMRIGELMALTRADVDLNIGTINVNKSYVRLNGKDIIGEPKTPKSNRRITIPSFLVEELKIYINGLYGLSDNDRIFSISKYLLVNEMKKTCKETGVKRIRLHDLRHSHASLLIEMGFSPVLIANRLGHENVETTLNTYSHLYPNKQEEVAEKLQKIK